MMVNEEEGPATKPAKSAKLAPVITIPIFQEAPEGSVTEEVAWHWEVIEYFPVKVSAAAIPLVATDQFAVTPPRPSNCKRPDRVLTPVTDVPESENPVPLKA